MSATSTKPYPLCVDLDGTLICNDTSWKSLWLLLRKNPFFLFKLPFWFLKGRAYLKQQMGKRIRFPTSNLIFHSEFLQWLKEQKKAGRTLALVTGTDESIAKTIAQQVPLFDYVFASNGTFNLVGKNKRQKLIEHFGEKQFAYAGNAHVDLAVWPHAAEAIVVNAPAAVLKKAKKTSTVTHVFPSPRTHE